MSPSYGEKVQVPDSYSDRIRSLRVAHSLTQMRLADLLGVAFATVNRWENGQSRPSQLAWRKVLLAERYGLEAFEPDFGLAVKEPVAVNEAPVQIPIEFTADPEKVRLVVEAERLTYGHLFNPAFATEVSVVDPLPHQRIAVYEQMLNQNPLRFLLADDAGAGKTIMSGLYIREMLSRRVIRRVLIIPPAGLVGNWQREMKQLFSLSFRVVTGVDARTGNPFEEEDSDLVIVSVDTLRGDLMFSRLQHEDVVPYDLVIFDEAHKLSARRDPDGTFRATERYRLAEAIAGIPSQDPRWRLTCTPTHFLLLTATPHMGKDYPYFCLWRLLEPNVLSTFDAFKEFPAELKHHHFIRRTKEEMVYFNGKRIYPERMSDTLSYDLTTGPISEKELYDQTTDYIQTYYNQARFLNRTAAHFAMSVLQRRMASSTYALLCSLQRRAEKLDQLIEDIRTGELSQDELIARDRELQELPDIYEEKTADEEDSQAGMEENERVSDEAMGSFVATSIADLQIERAKVSDLVTLAEKVYALGEESKFDKLRDVLADSHYRGQKFIIFTEHRDTLRFLVRRFEGLGYTGRIAQIHGGMNYQGRDAQVAFFQAPTDQGGAQFLVATDAAGEGINLQFCWLMVNYDIPWNPARLEQRMGRIHRYGQKHDPVIIINLVAGKTREGRVLKILLDKLEAIRKELGRDKVFDVIGRILEGVSIRDYMERAMTDAGADEAAKAIEGQLNPSHVTAIESQERAIYGNGGDVSHELDRLQTNLDREAYCRLLPGYIHRFIAHAAPALGITIEGDLNQTFSLHPAEQGALDTLWPILDTYPEDRRAALTIFRPDLSQKAIFLRPGEPLFDAICARVRHRFADDAIRGAVFVDPTVDKPYFFFLLLVKILRKPDPTFASFRAEEVIESRLVGLRCSVEGELQECPVEHLLLLRGSFGGLPGSAVRFAASVKDALGQARTYAADFLSAGYAAEHKEKLAQSLPQRGEFIKRGFDYQEAELADRRVQLSEKVRAGESRFKPDLDEIKARQQALSKQCADALAILQREPELIEAAPVELLAHALVIPSSDPEDRKSYDKDIEEIAVKVVIAYEESDHATVRDVSTSAKARLAGLIDWPGFDLLSRRPSGEERDIEVKGRFGVGDVDISENEFAKACNLRAKYWLYVVFDCATSHPRLVRVQDPFMKLIVRRRGVTVDEKDILAACESSSN
jgi:superfamily II DNA or RNA helicase/transcriptional regulator with XRE-family HTH domain